MDSIPLAALIRIQISFFLFSLFQIFMAINFKIMINRIQIIWRAQIDLSATQLKVSIFKNVNVKKIRYWFSDLQNSWRTRSENVFTSSSFREENLFIWVHKFVCVRQSLKIKKRKNWENQTASLYRRSRYSQNRPGGSVLFAGQSAITNFHLSARRKTEFKWRSALEMLFLPSHTE